MTNELKRVSVKLVSDPPLLSNTPLNSPEAAERLLGELIGMLDREVFAVINLKSNYEAINCSIISQGVIDHTLANPAEILKTAILSNASHIIVMHNHPSGNINPSINDIYITNRMEEVCNLIGISLVDHIIVSPERDKYYSFKEKDMLPSYQIDTDKMYQKLKDEVIDINKEYTIKNIVNKYFKESIEDIDIKTGYGMLESIISDIDKVLDTNISSKLKNKAIEEEIIRNDIKKLKKQLGVMKR